MMSAAATRSIHAVLSVIASSAITSCALAVSFDDFNARSWAVEGSVSGLGDQRVALRLNGERFEVGNGPFTSRRVADGSAYSLTIEAQPRNGRCSIAGGEGIVAGANVTGVDVRCNEFYGVGGTIAGLDGGLVRLALRTLTPNDVLVATRAFGDGRFSFSPFEARLQNGARFSLDIVQPLPVGRACKVSMKEGSIAKADADRLLVACTTEGPDLASLSVHLCSPDDVAAGLSCAAPASIVPEFAPDTVAYTLTASPNCESYKLCLRVSAVARHPDSRIRLNGMPFIAGADVVVNPAIGSQNVDFAVTAPDGVTERHYVVAVTVLRP
jgi:hypothetical protein